MKDYRLSTDYYEYYQELDPVRRKKLLDDLITRGIDDGGNAFRQDLYSRRYVDPKQPKQLVDRTLWDFMESFVLLRNSRFFVKRAKKEADKMFSAMGVDEANAGGELTRKCFYWETRNAMKRYLTTIRSSGYRRKVFGIMQSSDSEREWLSAKDAYMISCGIAKRLDMEERLQVYCEACEHEYSMLDDDAAARFRENAEEN